MIKSKKKVVNGFVGHEIDIEVDGPDDFCKEVHDIIMAYTSADKMKAVICLKAITSLVEGSKLNFTKDYRENQ